MSINRSNDYKKKIRVMQKRFIKAAEWQEATNLLEDELKKSPNDYFLLSQLGELYSKMQKYDKAILFTEQAYQLAPNCSFVLNNHAIVLYMHKRNNEAIEIWESLLKKSMIEIAEDACNEGVKFAKSLINDIHFRIADAYLVNNENEKALGHYRDHLGNRRYGQFSSFSKQKAEQKVDDLKAKIANKKANNPKTLLHHNLSAPK